MDNLNEENDLMKRCSDCGILKLKTEFCFRNIIQKLKKECAQCTKIRQRVYNFENKEKIKMYAKQNKENLKIIKIIDVKQVLNFN